MGWESVGFYSIIGSKIRISAVYSQQGDHPTPIYQKGYAPYTVKNFNHFNSQFFKELIALNLHCLVFV